MSTKDAEKWIPKDIRAGKAFDIINKRYPYIKSEQQIRSLMEKGTQRQLQFAGDYFTAAVAFLANRSSDPIIENIGDLAWRAINQKQVLPVLVNNIALASIQLGVPPQIVIDKSLGNKSFKDAVNNGVPLANALTNNYNEKEPFTIFLGNKVGSTMTQIGYTLLTPYFILQCREQPELSIATMTFLGSQIRDFSTGRVGTESSAFIEQRASATESHFLLQALKQKPSLQLQISEPYKTALETYPLGLDSVQLPQGTKYIYSVGENSILS